MQFTGKAPTTGLNDARRDKHELARTNALVVNALRDDPAFSVWTVAGDQWICPYLGTLVPSVRGDLESAQRYLFQARPWLARRQTKPRPLFQVLEQRWRLHFASAAGSPDLAAIHKNGAWRDPQTGETLRLPAAGAGKGQVSVGAIARWLAEHDVATMERVRAVGAPATNMGK
jgi:hypothetical protein